MCLVTKLFINTFNLTFKLIFHNIIKQSEPPVSWLEIVNYEQCSVMHIQLALTPVSHTLPTTTKTRCNTTT